MEKAAPLIFAWKGKDNHVSLLNQTIDRLYMRMMLLYALRCRETISASNISTLPKKGILPIPRR
jgi:hypothetical protein